MKLSKLTFLTCCAAGFLVAGQFAGAQAPDDPMSPHRHGPPNLTAMLTHMLSLTDAQQTQVKALVAEVQPQLDAIHEQARQAADAIIKQLDAKIRPLLTADQQKRFDALETLRETRPSGPGPE
jgi:Spy/CpxP family protein refolding chaperone